MSSISAHHEAHTQTATVSPTESPQDRVAGNDVQLDEAISIVTRQLREQPPSRPPSIESP